MFSFCNFLSEPNSKNPFLFDRGFGNSLLLSDRSDRREQLRKERKEEYRKLLESKKEEKMRSNLVSDARRRLAEERAMELTVSNHERQSERVNGGSERREESYDELRARKRAEERQYRERVKDSLSPAPALEKRIVHFSEADHDARGSHQRRVRRGWDEEPFRPRGDMAEDAPERERFVTSSEGRRCEALGRSQDGSRSKSAPLNSQGILGLGGSETSEERRAKQQAYARELRQQISMKTKPHQATEGRSSRVEGRSSRVEGRSSRVEGRSSWVEGRSSRVGGHDEQLMPSPFKSREQFQSLEDHRPHPQIPHWNQYAPPGSYYPQPYPMLPPGVHYPPPHPPPMGYYYPPPPLPPQFGYYDQFHSQPRVEEKRQLPSREASSHHGNQTEDCASQSPQVSPRGPVPVLDKEVYRNVLKEQIREKQFKRDREKEKQAELDKRKEKEMEVYDPWGKGGGGAPLRDPAGELVTDLRKMKKLNDSPNSEKHIQRVKSSLGDQPDSQEHPKPATEQVGFNMGIGYHCLCCKIWREIAVWLCETMYFEPNLIWS